MCFAHDKRSLQKNLAQADSVLGNEGINAVREDTSQKRHGD